MDALVEVGTSRLSALLHPLTPFHLTLFLIISVVAIYVFETLLQIKWFRKLYAALLILGLVSMIHHRNKKGVAKDIFKLALL